MISRRAFLRGAGTLVALPALDSLRAFAQDASPLRMAFLFVDNGVVVPKWRLEGDGPLGALSPTLQPLEPVKKHVLVLSGLAHRNGEALGDGPGDHARAAAVYLTGAHPRKTDGKDIRAGVSVDQFAAQRIGDRTRLPSLELGCERGAQAGNCDSGYSCAYSSNISWRAPASPQPKIVSPREAFARLFGDPDAGETEQERARRAAERASVLDLVADEARRLRGSLGAADQSKLDDYLESVRAVEKRIQARDAERRAVPKMDLPAATPSDYPAHLRLLLDLLVLAFESDATRIASVMFGNAGSERTFPFLEVREGHHFLSHHGDERDKLAKLQKIDQFHVGEFARFVAKLRSVKEGTKTLLDSCMVVYGGAIGDGNAHNHDDLPILFAGRGGGTVEPGRHVRFKRGTPMCNLFLSMLDRVNVRVERFGDSTGRAVI
jgi:hypothetical protein